MTQIEIKTNYMPEIGKNKMKGWARGHYYTQPDYKQGIEIIANWINLESNAAKAVWKKKKIWVEVFLQKPMMRCDVANFVDAICDAVKQGIGIDDQYFSIKFDWEYKKDQESFMTIKVIQ